MTQPLFRPEVLEAKRGSWLGGISLALQEQERVQTQACGARMVTAPVTGVVAMQVAKPGKRRRLGRQGIAECASVPGAGNASILEEEKEMRELSSLEIRGVDGGLRSVFWSAVAEVVISSVKGAYNYVTDDGAGGGEAFQNGDPTVVANVYGA